jgi:protocatechuate 3,4-dioxygenase beta subunit
MSRKTIVALVACALLAHISVLWLIQRVHTREPLPVAPDDNTPSLSAPELSSGESHEARESVGVATSSFDSPGSEETATLVVHLVAKETGKPIRTAHLSLLPNPVHGNSYTIVETAVGTMHESLRPDESGTVFFKEIETGESLQLFVNGDPNLASSERQDVDPFAAGERRELRVQIATEDDVVFFGRVIAREDRSPITQARVHSVVASETQPTIRGRHVDVATLAETSTDADGYFKLALAKWRSPRVRVDADHFGLAIITPTVLHDTREHARVIALERLAGLTVRVVAADGKPVVGAHVAVEAPSELLDRALEVETVDWGGTNIPDERWEADCDPEGVCPFENLPSKTDLGVEISLRGTVVRRTDWIELKPDERRDLVLRVGGGCTLKGVVLDEAGHTVRGQEIWLVKGTGEACACLKPSLPENLITRRISDSDGHFEFKNVEPGNWCIGPAPLPWGEATKDESAVAPAGEQIQVNDSPSQNVIVRLYRGLFIQGTVVGPNGDPVANAPVECFNSSRLYLTQSRTDERGNFISGPFALGSFELRVLYAVPYAPSDVVMADAGARDVVISLKQAGSVRGRVIDAGTGAPCEARLFAARENVEEPQEIMGFTGDGASIGEFVIQGLAPGKYGLCAYTRDGRFASVTGVDVLADRESEGLLLKVSPGARLRLRYDGSHGQAFATFASHGVPVAQSDPVNAGFILDKIVSAGSVAIGVRFDWRATARVINVDLSAGEVKEVVIHDE